MENYFDIVDYKLFLNSNLEDLENIFLKLNISKIYVCLDLTNTKNADLITKLDDFKTPIFKNIILKKIIIIDNLLLFNKLKTYINNIKNNKQNASSKDDFKNLKIIYKPKDLKSLSKLLNNKNFNLIYTPIFNKLGFDEGCCNLCSLNSKKIVFDLNVFRNNTYKSIKQSNFIFDILQKHYVDFCFASFAKNINELIDPKISKSFLENLNINNSLLNKIFSENYEL